MIMRRSVVAFALVGLAIPVIWMAIYHNSPTFAGWWLKAPHWVETLRLTAWPSAILLIADPLDNNVLLWIVSAVANAAVYAIVGWLILRASRRRR